jgi:hypothetical protein
MFCRPTLHAVNGLKSLSEANRRRNLEKTAGKTIANQGFAQTAGRLPVAGQRRGNEAGKPFLLPAGLPDLSRRD